MAAFDADVLEAIYTSPGSSVVEAGDQVTRGFLDRETVALSDGIGLVRTMSQTLRVRSGTLTEASVDTTIQIDGATYRVLQGPEPIDDGAEQILTVAGPL